MSYAIVYSSRTGNTELLAHTIESALDASECVYSGPLDDKALEADTIYCGFWTFKGTCDAKVEAFLGQCHDKNLFLFGTCGYGKDPAYQQQIIDRVAACVGADNQLIGSYMCQAKMPMSVRDRYVSLKESGQAPDNIDDLIENFDEALSHPDDADLTRLASSLA